MNAPGTFINNQQSEPVMRISQEEARLWPVILAGGEGHRMQPLIRRWLGREKPKQYCTFVGTRSMFQHTLDRADMLAAPERKVTVVARSHRAEVLQQMGRRQPGKILLQPANHDTAAGVFLALSYVWAQDPRALVALFPSDHFIFPEDCFIEIVRSASSALNTWPEKVILLGAPPDRPEPEYGWIHPGAELGCFEGHPVRTVRSFVEKPCDESARRALDDGAMWNTLVLVSRIETLWKLGSRCFPALMGHFEKLRSVIGRDEEDRVLGEIYREMPVHNFSSDLLARVTDQTAVIRLRDILWSDWGRPERVSDTLATLGKQPAFPRALSCAS
jgi:mannose-1-phosphate guanylyltransferase